MNIDVHPAAAVFPMMPEDELKEMAKSITAFGLREKIGTIIDPDDLDRVLVLDGRNRLEALRKVGVKDDVIIENFTQPLDLDKYRCTPEEYVLMANIERRNLTAGQRRELAGKLAVMLSERQKDAPKEEQQDTLTEAARLAGVSRRTAATAKKQVLVDAGKKPKPKPASTKSVGSGIASRQILKHLQDDAQALTKSGHTFNPETLQEIAITATNMATIARQRIQLIAERTAEKLAAMQAGAESVAAEAAAEAAANDNGEEEPPEAA